MTFPGGCPEKWGCELLRYLHLPGPAGYLVSAKLPGYQRYTGVDQISNLQGKQSKLQSMGCKKPILANHGLHFQDECDEQKRRPVNPVYLRVDWLLCCYNLPDIRTILILACYILMYI